MLVRGAQLWVIFCAFRQRDHAVRAWFPTGRQPRRFRRKELQMSHDASYLFRSGVVHTSLSNQPKRDARPVPFLGLCLHADLQSWPLRIEFVSSHRTDTPHSVPPSDRP